jgi:hypothetical protein
LEQNRNYVNRPQAGERYIGLFWPSHAAMRKPLSN